MEDKSIQKLNIVDNLPSDSPKDPPAVPRKEDGTIDLDKITLEVDEKGNRIIPNDIFDNFYKELPDKVINQSKSWRTSNGGKIKILGSDPADAYIHRRGADASNATQAQRRTFKDTIEYMLRQKAKKSVIEDLELTEDATNLDMIIASALKQAAKGNTKAYEFLRDTAGEKPTEKISAEVETITAEDRERIEKILQRDNHNI